MCSVLVKKRATALKSPDVQFRPQLCAFFKF